jgi:hypothetical protein
MATATVTSSYVPPPQPWYIATTLFSVPAKGGGTLPITPQFLMYAAMGAGAGYLIGKQTGALIGGAAVAVFLWYVAGVSL